jgi:hypothetical protein
MVEAVGDIGPQWARGQAGPRLQGLGRSDASSTRHRRGDAPTAGPKPLEHPLDEPSRRYFDAFGAVYLVEQRPTSDTLYGGTIPEAPPGVPNRAPTSE